MNIYFFSLLDAMNKDDLFGYLYNAEMSSGDFKNGNYIYFLFNNGVIVYIGQTINILQRLGSHYKKGSIEFDSFKYFRCLEKEQKIIENFLIDYFEPKYNQKVLNWFPYGVYPIYSRSFETLEAQDDFEQIILKKMYKIECNGEMSFSERRDFYWFVSGMNFLHRKLGLIYDKILFEDNKYIVSFKDLKFNLKEFQNGEKLCCSN